MGHAQINIRLLHVVTWCNHCLQAQTTQYANPEDDPNSLEGIISFLFNVETKYNICIIFCL